MNSVFIIARPAAPAIGSEASWGDHCSGWEFRESRYLDAKSLGRALSRRFPVGSERLAAARFNSHGKLSLMPPNVKNQTNAKISYGDAFASSIRPAIRNPSKPATPKTVTARSAPDAARILDLRPIPFPIRSTWPRRHRKTSRREPPKYRRVIEREGACRAVRHAAA